MFQNDKILQLRQIINSCFESQGFELVDLICRFEGRDLLLRVLVDLPEGGISIGECARLSRQISMELEEKNIIQDLYVLEVSSPGLDRALMSRNDFARCRNKLVKFFLKEMFNGKLEWDGRINKVSEDTVSIEVKGEILEIPLAKIHKGKQLIE